MRAQPHRVRAPLAIIFVLVTALLVFPPVPREAHAARVTLAWDYTDSGAAGFVLYCGSSSGTYGTRIDVGNVETYTISTLPEGATAFCAVTAYDSAKVESLYSNELSVAVPAPTPPAPTVTISASPADGAAPLNVAFTNTTSGEVTSWSWNFGDGTTSTAQSPTHLYSAPGRYNVSLTATGPGGTATNSLAAAIDVVSNCACTLWPSTATPGTVDSGDSRAVELGVKFRAEVSGSITGIRFYKSIANTGTHVAHLWTAAGALIATATFTSETTSGWQQVNFAAPVAITAGAIYIASYHTKTGHYAHDVGYFVNGIDNGPLHAPKDGVSGGNSVFAYGTGTLFPSNTYKSSNYWVDVVFRPAPNQSQYSFWPGNPTPSWGNDGDSNSVELGVKFRADVNGLLTGIRFYKFGGNTGTHVAHLWNKSGTLLASATFANETASGWQQVNFATPVPIAAGATYIASYHTDTGHYADAVGHFTADGVDNGPLHALRDGADGLNGVYAYGAQALFPSNSWKGSNYWVDVEFTACPCTLWPANTTPSLQNAADGNPVELGVKFRSEVNGTISAIRFFKSVANTGTHVANLWDAAGNLLARATFTNETSSGWQQVNFSTPVPIAAGILYVASYHTNTGHYADDVGYFSSSATDSIPLHSPKDGDTGGNGVFAYGSASTFPRNTYRASNYWVDVVFNPK